MKRFLIISIAILLFISCNNLSKKQEANNNDGQTNHIEPPPPPADYYANQEPVFLDSLPVILQIDTSLSHQKNGFPCDSVIAIDYNGAFGEHTYEPLNKKGQWINTIKNRRKLTNKQVEFIHSVFGDPKTFKNPMMVACYEPRLGFVFYKHSKVIAQSAVCLGCAGIESSATLGSGDHYASFNEKAEDMLTTLYKELKFECSFPK